MAKTDFKTDRKDLYAPPAGEFVEIMVPMMTFAAIDGHGDPNTSDGYRHSVEALFAVSFAAKFTSTRETRSGLRRRPPSEGLWSAAHPAPSSSERKSSGPGR